MIFGRPMHNAAELEGQVEVRFLSSHSNEVLVAVVVQPEEIASAEGEIINFIS